MSDTKPEFLFTISGITNADGSEQFQIQFNGKAGETEEQLGDKVAMAQRLFDSVWLRNNKKALVVADNIKKQNTQELPKQFN